MAFPLPWFQFSAEDRLAAVFVVGFSLSGNVIGIPWSKYSGIYDYFSSCFVIKLHILYSFYHYKLAEDGESDEQVVLVSQSGTANRFKVRDVSIQSRYARYVLYGLLYSEIYML